MLFFAVVGLVAAALLLSHALFAGLPDPARQPAPIETASILITDQHGRLLYEVIDPAGNKRVPLALEQIPLACQQATLATEDSRFYSHPGVDFLAVLRAAFQNWRQGHTVSGASTLTQQLARNLYLPEDERVERSLRRKLREAWLAWRLERLYSKDELLALYFNTTYYGHFAVGIEAAAQAYFGVHAWELDLAQCALLAGLPQYPAGYNPIEHPEAARYRQGVVLDLMVHNGYITAEQAAEARGERLAFASAPFTIEAPHFVMWVQSQLEEMLGRERLRRGGLRVITTLDLDWQHQAEAIVARWLARLRPCAAGYPAPLCDPDANPARRVDNAGLVALGPQDGAVLAMVGSPNYFDATISGAVNAALSPRQPGSAIKPLTYAAALDPERAAQAGQQPWTAATLIYDVRTVFSTAEGAPYVPHNYDLRFHGPVTVRDALANSYNIPAVKVLEHIGVDALIELGERLGISWIENFEPQIANSSTPNPQSAVRSPTSAFGLALTLGGGEVRLLDLTAAYAAFANGGHRVTPYGISRVETLAGEVLLDTSLSARASSSPEVLDPRVAYIITDILSDEMARWPAFGAGNPLEIGRPAAAKTGTTTDWRDNWTIGYTPDLVAGVWVGNADNQPMRDVSGISGAGPIWHHFMVSVLRDTPPREFARPAGLVRVEVCADSGLLPAQAEELGRAREQENPFGRAISLNSTLSPAVVPCPHRRFEWFIEGTEPQEVDQSHVRIAVDIRTGEPANPSTPAEYIRQQIYWLLPPELQAWARENHIPQPDMTAWDITAKGWDSGDALVLTSPDPNRVYRLDPALPRETQQLPITVVPRTELAIGGWPITLLVDGQPLATVSEPEYTAWWPLAQGQHTFRAFISRPDGTLVYSAPVSIIVVE